MLRKLRREEGKGLRGRGRGQERQNKMEGGQVGRRGRFRVAGWAGKLARILSVSEQRNLSISW